MVDHPKCMYPRPPKETTPTCGCHATGPVTAYETGVLLRFCPKHAAVDALIVACEAIVHATKMNDSALGAVAALLAQDALTKAGW